MIKSITISLVVLISTVALIFCGTFACRGKLGDLLYDIRESNTTEDYYRIAEKLDKYYNYFSIVMSDIALLELRCALFEVIEYSEAGTLDEAAAAKSRLYARIEEQRRMCGISFSSIF